MAEMIEPQAAGACPRCARMAHPDEPQACAVTSEHVNMIADYVRFHPGCDHLDAEIGVGGDIRRAANALRTALEQALVRDIWTEAGYRLYSVPDPGDPWPLEPGAGHGAFAAPSAVPTEAARGWPVTAPDDFIRFPLSSRCGACGVRVGRAAPWEGWHHCRQNCPVCYPEKCG